MAISPLLAEDPPKLGPYLLVGRLGSGGMGAVFLARSETGRTVAIKTMHARLAADPEFRTRFRLETDAARVLGGRHGAAVVAADPQAETPWLATEYVLGPSLDEAVEQHGVLPEDCVRAVGSQLCAALEQLHSSGVVHRDVKPSNILLTVHGPRVIDFGIARAVGDARLTRTGAAAGTPAFMSPEQATGGEHGLPGEVFALAGVLVFALTGRGPFGSGQAADLLYRVRYAEPDLIGAPKGLVEVLSSCLAKEPEKRPTIGALRSALDGSDSRSALGGSGSETGVDGRHSDRTSFATLLPRAVLHDIALRCEQACAPAPALSVRNVPTDVSTATASGGQKARSVSRRRALALSAVGTAAVAGGAYGVHHVLSGRGSGRTKQAAGADGSSRSSRRPGTPPRPVWRQTISTEGSDSFPYAAGDTVLVPVSLRGLIAFDAKNGKQRWMLEGTDAASQLAVEGDRLFVVRDALGGSLGIAQVDLARGDFARTVTKGTDFEGFKAILLGARDDDLCVIAQTAKSSLSEHADWRLLRYDVRTGRERWRRRLPARWAPADTTGGVAGALAGRHLVLLRNGRAAVRDIRTGKTVWEKEIPTTDIERSGGPRAGQLAYSSTHLFVGSDEVLALRLRDGHVSWRFGKGRTKELGDGFERKHDRRYGPPTLKDGVVYAMEGQRGWVALDAGNGRLLWEEKQSGQPAELDSPPVIGRKNVYGTVDSSRLVAAVGRRSHSAAWTYSTSGASGLARGMAAHPGRNLLVLVSGSTVVALPLE